MIFFLFQFGTTIGGLLLAVGAFLVTRRSLVGLPVAMRVSSSIGVGIALICFILFNAWMVFPMWLPELGDESYLILMFARFLAPLLLSLLTLVSLVLPWPARGPRGSAQLEPRTVTTFAPRGWLLTAAAVVVAVVSVAVAAGVASSPDDSGRYALYEVTVSSNSSVASTIFGWYFSLPCLAVIAALAVLATIALLAISRPPLAADSERDAAVRRARARNALSMCVGGVLIHLGAVLFSLFGTSGLRTEFLGGAAGQVALGTPFAAIGPALQFSSSAAVVIGLAMWWFTLLSVAAVSSRRTQLIPAR